MGKRIWTTDLLTVAAGSPEEYVRLFDEITDALTTVCGLVQTGDTGQLDSLSPPSLSANLSSNNLFGYRIFRFNDSLQAVRPIYLRIEMKYVVRSNQTTDRLPYFTFQVGAGSDGVGSLTAPGVAYSRPYSWGGSAWSALSVMPSGGYPSFACGGDGFAWLAFKVGAIPVLAQAGQPYPPRTNAKGAMFILAIMRSTNVDGELTGEGLMSYFGTTMYQNGSSVYWTSGLQSPVLEVRNSGGITVCGDTLNVPLLQTFPTSGGKPILGRISTPFAGLPASPFLGVTSIYLADGDTFTAALVGATERGYIYPGASFSTMQFTPNNTPPWAAPFFLWEGANV